MIKANELRVGNFLKFNNFIGGEEEIIQIDLRFFASWAGGRSPKEMKFDEELSNYYTGIELTPEVLLAAGFQKNKWAEEYSRSLFGDYSLSFDEVLTFKCDDDFYNYNLTQIKYLHQLQNLIHSLTGTELEIDLIKAIK